MSSFNGHVAIVNVLLSRGAHIDEQDGVSKIILYCYNSEVSPGYVWVFHHGSSDGPEHF